MKIIVPKESAPEKRVALTPTVAKKIIALGCEIYIEKGLGETISVSDQEYQKAGVQIASSKEELFKNAKIILKVQKPTEQELSLMDEGSIHVSFLNPFYEKELIAKIAKKKATAVSLEMMPRTTIAQKMDALSSQANLAGYAAVLRGSEKLNIILPMMTTPAGTIYPAKVFIIGVGVAGLQAIATARRLGAQVYVFDVRSAVKEEVQSLGGKFVEVEGAVED
ncbi:MAG TPA: hypothetical protein P5048_05150, partial [Chlamydiales bacterium]|nr:hypothetical protein [Chlamydiales bacterium]